MNPPVGWRVLVIDDNPDDRALVRRALGRALPGCDVVEVSDPGTLEAALSIPPDAVVTDYSLRWSDGLAVQAAVAGRWPGTPIVMFTGTGNEEVAVEAMRLGLADYVVKSPGSYARLPFAVDRALRHRAEQVRLAAVEGRYRELVELVPAVIEITALDEEATPLFVSPQIERQLGYPVASWLGEPGLWLRSIHPDDAEVVLAAHRRQLEDLQPFSTEYRVRRADGSVAWIRDDSVVARGEDGRPLHALGFRFDVTDRHELEDRLRQVEKMEAIGQLASGIAHDFNNVLTIIRGNAEHVRAAAAGSVLADEAAAIVKAAERAAVLTARLLAFSRRRPVRPEPLDLPDETRSLFELLHRLLGPAIELSLDHDGAPVAAVMDRGHYAQVLINLAVNARDAIAGPGHLRVALRRDPPDPLHRGEAVVVVEDDGPGMPPEVAARAFEPFFTTKGEHGTGLGLATVWGAVQASGGTIRVVSAPAAGARFEIRIPAAIGVGVRAPTPVAAGETAAGQPVRGTPGDNNVVPADGARRPAVLVVEDEPAIQSLIRRILERDGFEVSMTSDGPTAIELLGSGATIDLLLTDLNLPGAPGDVIVQASRVVRPELPIVLMSGAFGTEPPDGVRLLAKPFSPAELTATLLAALAPEDRP